MAQDCFTILGLSPGRYDQWEVTRRFLSERNRLLVEIEGPNRAEASRKLDELYIAYNALRDPRRQVEYLRANKPAADAHEALRGLIEASLEGGLLRHSRRQIILERAAELGLSEFQAQLLIAQVQFGEPDARPLTGVAGRPIHRPDPRGWARLAGVGVLALALFLAMVHWLGA